MLTTLNMALARCPMGFSEEIEREREFSQIKNLKVTPKMTKIPKFYIFFQSF